MSLLTTSRSTDKKNILCLYCCFTFLKCLTIYNAIVYSYHILNVNVYFCIFAECNYGLLSNNMQYDVICSEWKRLPQYPWGSFTNASTVVSSLALIFAAVNALLPSPLKSSSVHKYSHNSSPFIMWTFS